MDLNHSFGVFVCFVMRNSIYRTVLIIKRSWNITSNPLQLIQFQEFSRFFQILPVAWSELWIFFHISYNALLWIKLSFLGWSLTVSTALFNLHISLGLQSLCKINSFLVHQKGWGWQNTHWIAVVEIKKAQNVNSHCGQTDAMKLIPDFCKVRSLLITGRLFAATENSIFRG